MKSMSKRIAAACAALGMFLTAQAQPGMGQQVPSTVVNQDNTVTFNYSNRNAKDVKIWTQFSGDVDMTKGQNGLWTVTVGPANPDIYPYHFTVDGISVMDPQCAGLRMWDALSVYGDKSTAEL